MNQRYCNGMIHVIKKGDNLYQLSRKYRIPLALILRANPYVDVYNLQIGQEICIPVARPYPPMGTGRMEDMNPEEVRGTDDNDERTEDRRMNDEKMNSERINVDRRDDERDDNDDDTVRYVSDGTKSLGGILREYGMDLSDFLEKNDLDRVVVAADVVLYLPKKV